MIKKSKKVVTKKVIKNKASIVPLGDKVLIRPAEKMTEQRTQGGIIIPGKPQDEKQERGVVVAIGKGRYDESGKRMPMEVTVGDAVIYVRGYEYQELKVDGVDHILIGANSILAITQ